jgi:hypothetical protein
LLVTDYSDGSPHWKCRSVNPDGSLNCDSVTYPRGNGDTLQPVRFNGTYNLAVTIRVFNAAGSPSQTLPYQALLEASSREWNVTHDTGFLPAVGPNKDATDWVEHTWYNLPMMPGDTLTLALKHISRQTASFWPDYSLQFQRIRLRLNTSLGANHDQDALAYSSWLYGEFAPPPPPPPPHGGGAGGINGMAVEG